MRISLAVLAAVGLLQGLHAATVQVASKIDSDNTLPLGVSTSVTGATAGIKESTSGTGSTAGIRVSTSGTGSTAGISGMSETVTSAPVTLTRKASTQKRKTLPPSTAKTPTKRPSKLSQANRQPLEPSLNLAEPCDESICQLPNCRCSDTKLGHNIPTDKIPQLVTITFDDAVTALNYEIFDELFNDIRNPDGCEPSATFYFSHEYTDYTKVHSLWAQGHELALHSITHGMGTMYWKKATVEILTKEFGQQIEMIEHFAQIDKADIRGMRMPHFEIAGNNSYLVAQQLGLLYDSSWPTQRFTDPALWPYTLDYKSMQDCPIGKCPDASFPGLWENPLVNWEDVMGFKCAMVDACIHLPEDDIEKLVEWMIRNFNRHYLGNRAPFGAYLHSSWFQKGEHYLAAFKEFIQYMNKHNDVYFVSASRVIEYMQTPVADKPFRGCPKKHENSCQPTLCQLRKVDTKDDRWMSSCSPCPEVYPWVDNPMGLSKPAL